MRAGRQCRGRRCRDVPAGASDVSTGRRMHLQRTDALNLRGPAGAFPQKNLRAPTLCIPSFNKRLCAVSVYVHFEKQRTHLVGTSLHPPAGRQPLSGIRRQRQKPRCVQDSDIGTYRQVRPTCQPAGGCIYKERMPLNLRGPAGAFPQKEPPRTAPFASRLLISVCALCRHTFILKNNGRTLSVRPYISLLAGNRNQG